ncbi:3-phosphoserine/phosphohydroxythreonine transaminase [Legionella micdadei]|uniref:Phosphoserine aminotransferase n=1 Tax=Legionella micdadei TaxID=451 RepID=A0A098GF55_LEGMI|nr:3-phosphoserine/phosphohydroxythreonine transaminase [Legionella micdadei]KTD28306.1 phosphoserine aminotransferase [Legionella micdadei]NSL16934.1 3-phosphoserine/phosphohydroxythreonine transaminase [Legionella micdadei]CEG61104.1 Phosphoserine aminotransferase [Legionella micdadei]SCY30310.1 phosphoserine aminotransferase apoenzyme [Legionella micdadei]
MSRGYNFGAGPAMLPESILKEVQEELLDWHNLGMSVMEIGHRTPEFTALMEQTEHELRALLMIPDSYHVLFLSGAARTQFGMIPLNFLAPTEQAGYLVTGLWSYMAYQEACRLRQAYCVATGEKNGFISIPALDEWQLREDTRYLYFTPNETVNGVRFREIPKIHDTPLVADMTSCLLSEPINVEDYGLIFAGAQKNIAIAGLTIIIVSDEFLGTIKNTELPTMLDYRTFSSTKSAYATPPTFNCYLAHKMFQWIKKQGGVEALYRVNCQKASKLYDYIDSSHFYKCTIAKEARSLVNVCFTLKDPKLENTFIESAKSRGLLALKGHRSVGGLRASLYNAMPIEGVDRLIEFMDDFTKEYK